MEKGKTIRDHTPYDDAFRTLVTKGGNLIIPFINEMFPSLEPIKMDARIISLSDELFINLGNGKQQKIIADSLLHINDKTYHVECQSVDDGDILVRMAEYDMGIALRESVFENGHLYIHLPRSGVLYLRKTGKTPREMSVILETPGGKVEYTIPTTCLADYSLDGLMQKHLLFLIPFYLFNFESSFPAYEAGKTDAREQVESSLETALQALNKNYKEGYCTLSQYLLITDMLKKVTDNLTNGYGQIRKELDAIMGGKILEFKGEKLINQGREEGMQEGSIRTLAELVHDGMLPLEAAETMVGKKYGVSRADFRAMVKSYKPDERMEG